MLLRRPLLLVAAFLAAATTARAKIEFVGVLVMPGRSLFALSDDPAKPATWRSLGQDFAGYRLTEFDAKADTLVLTKSGATLRVYLKGDARVKAARLELAGTIIIGQGEKIEVTRVTLVFDQETVLPATDGFALRIAPWRTPDGKVRYTIQTERAAKEGATSKSATRRVWVIDGLPDASFKCVVDGAELSFTPASK
jgi:hypothetical protein